MPRGSAFFAAHVAFPASLLPNPATLMRALSALLPVAVINSASS